MDDDFDFTGLPDFAVNIINSYQQAAAAGLQEAVGSFTGGESTEVDLPAFAVSPVAEGEGEGMEPALPEQISTTEQQELIAAGIENIPLDGNDSMTETSNSSGIVFNYQDGQVVGQIGNEQVVAFNIPSGPFDIGSFA